MSRSEPLSPVLVHRLAERIYAQPLTEGGEALAIPPGGGIYVGDATKITVHIEGKADTEGWIAHSEKSTQIGVQRTRAAVVELLLEAHGMRAVEANETIPALF